jgi:hypothetical protein
MTKKIIMLAAMIVCTSAMIACSDDNSSTKADSGSCQCTSKSSYVNVSDMNSTASSIRNEEGCQKYDHGSAGYFSCEWVRY